MISRLDEKKQGVSQWQLWSLKGLCSLGYALSRNPELTPAGAEAPEPFLPKTWCWRPR